MTRVENPSLRISNAEYHALPGISASRLKVFLRDPREYWYQFLSGQFYPEAKAEFDFGSAVHSIALEKDRSGIIEIPDSVLSASGSRAGNAWKSFAAENSDKILLKTKDYRRVLDCVDSLANHPVANHYLSAIGSVEIERTYSVIDDTLDLSLRCKPDKLFPVSDELATVIDLKTTAVGTRPKQFARSVANFGYHVQEYFYRRVLRACDIEVDRFVFIAVSTEPPYTVDCYSLSAEFLRLAETSVENALEDLAERTRENRWYPLSFQSIVELGPPNFLKYDSEYDL